MFITPHMLAGAVVGVKVSSPWTAIFLGLFSHYLLDFLPHWDYLKELKIDKKEHFFLKIFLDLIIGTIIVLFLVWNMPNKIIILIAISFALLPDFLEFIYINFKVKKLEFLSNFHHKIHHWKYLSFSKGFPVTLIVSIVSILIILS